MRKEEEIMDNKELAKQIIKDLGGEENISQSWHCITRLRFNVHNKNKVNLERIKSLAGVMGAQFQSGQFQVIIGNEVANVYAEVSQLLERNTSHAEAPKGKFNLLDSIFDTISGIFTPILPAIVGAGLLKGIMALLVAMNLLSETSSNYEILNFISDAPFHFLPFLVAFSAANKFKTDPSLAVALAGVLMYPKIMEYAAGGEVTSLKFLGLSIPMNSYASSVIPIILGVWLLSYVYKSINKAVPNSLKIVFSPLLALLITAPLTLIFIAPLGNYIGVYLEMLFSSLFDIAGPVAGFLMGGLMPLIVITGMHYAFFPSTFASFSKYGYDIMLLPMNLVSNFAQAGATLGVFFKTKDKKMKQLSISTFIPAVFGITEPAIYGVTMKLKKPFYASLAGGAVGGAIFGTFAVKAMAFSIPGVMSLPTYIVEGSSNFVFALLGIALSFVVSFVLTLIIKFDEAPKQTETTATVIKSSSAPVSTPERPIDVVAPLNGMVLPLEAIPDDTFATGMVGKGVAILPTEGKVKSPFNGKVTMITPTNHAIGITSDEGAELLIHIGLETVNLKGEGFNLNVEEGQTIEKGDVLLTFDLEWLTEQNVSLISPVIVTNTPHYLDIIHTADQEVIAGESKLLMLIN